MTDLTADRQVLNSRGQQIFASSSPWYCSLLDFLQGQTMADADARECQIADSGVKGCYNISEARDMAAGDSARDGVPTARCPRPGYAPPLAAPGTLGSIRLLPRKYVTFGPWQPWYTERHCGSMESVLPGQQDPDESGTWWAWPLEFAERGCCCPARPTALVVMPPADGRPYPVDLLLCSRHYRTSVGALLAADAAVYHMAGVVVPAARTAPESAGAW
jgi:hypothetical protein